MYAFSEIRYIQGGAGLPNGSVFMHDDGHPVSFASAHDVHDSATNCSSYITGVFGSLSLLVVPTGVPRKVAGFKNFSTC